MALSLQENTALQPVALQELDMIHIRLEGIREKCLVEELPENTVVLVKHSATSWNSQTKQRQDIPFQLLTTVRDPSGHTVMRQQSKAMDRLFMTAATTGPHLICFQAMLQQYSPHSLIKLGLEVFIGDAGDPQIVSPVEAHLTDLTFQISKAVDQAADIQREQTLQREREGEYAHASITLNSNVSRWAVCQVIFLALAAFYQVHHLRRFFRAKKLV